MKIYYLISIILLFDYIFNSSIYYNDLTNKLTKTLEIKAQNDYEFQIKVINNLAIYFTLMTNFIETSIFNKIDLN